MSDDVYETEPACPACGGRRIGVEVEFGQVDAEPGDISLAGIWHYSQRRIPVIDTEELARLAWDQAEVALHCYDCGWRLEAGRDWEHGRYRVERSS
jgi:hypothetical protein